MSINSLDVSNYLKNIYDHNAKKIVDSAHPDGLDVSRSLKDSDNNISSTKLAN